MSEFICWCNDFSKSSGEGQLANKFLNKYYKHKKKKIITIECKYVLSDYFNQIIGLFILWYYFFKGKKLVYINYLPLWNVIIFLLSPPNTEFGPITGSIQINEITGFKSLSRRYFFPILYKISLMILYKRSKYIIFSTNILKRFINKKFLKKTKFNFILENFKFKKIFRKRKEYDLIIYYRKHENKFFGHHYKLINNFIEKKKKIIVFGDKINIRGVLQLGKLKRKDVSKLITKSRYALSGDDNLLSLFNLECLENHVKIIYNKKLAFQIPKNFKKLFIPFGY